MGWGSPKQHGPAALEDLVGCTACHGAALDGGKSGVSCNGCHEGWQTNCTFCHSGTDGPQGSPPKDVAGNTSSAAVGAHTSHVIKTTLASPSRCSACHTLPANALSPDHIDPAPAEVKPGSGTWDHATATCSSVSCHGAFPECGLLSVGYVERSLEELQPELPRHQVLVASATPRRPRTLDKRASIG